MRFNYLANAIGLIMIYIGLVTLTPIVVAVFYQDFASIIPFLSAGLISIVVGYSMRTLVQNASKIDNLNDIKKAEALFIVAISWVIFGVIAGIPYLFYNLSPINALFESVSGITTTGATILTHFNYAKAFFFWRSLTQWLGGLGIIVLFIAILPQFAVAGRQMFFAEAPGPTEDKITPRIRNTASALWKIYAGLTIIEIILLYIAGMPLFDAICNSFSTLAAGGFSPNPESTMGYHSNWITWIITLFMFLAGTSFILVYKVVRQKNLMLFFKNQEFCLYGGLTLFLALLIGIALVAGNNYSVFDAVTHSLYQVISLTTSTGSASVDFVKWDFTAKVLLFIVMFMGSCASSAGGGIKMVRWLIIYKTMKSSLIRILHPNAIFNVKVDNMIVSQDVISQIVVFVFYYLFIFAVGAIVITIIEQNAVVGLSSSITCLGNIGPGFGRIIGPMSNFDSLHLSTKSILIAWMLIGRLEIIPFLVFLQKDFWTVALRR